MSQKAFREKVKNLVDTYALPAEIRRQMVRAGLDQIAMDNISNPDLAAQKLALDAFKAIGADTEIGINAPAQVAIQINTGNLDNLFTSFEKDDKVVNVVAEEQIEESKDEIYDAEGLLNLAPKES